MNCHITYGWRRRRVCAGFNEVTSLSVLLPVEAGWCVEAWRVSLWLYFQRRTCVQRFPVELKMNLPSREECERWDRVQVAAFLCKVSATRKASEARVACFLIISKYSGSFKLGGKLMMSFHFWLFLSVVVHVLLTEGLKSAGRERNIMELNTFNLCTSSRQLNQCVYRPQNKMQDCAALVNRLNINGRRLLVSPFLPFSSFHLNLPQSLLCPS